MTKADLEVLTFKTAAEWRKWLLKHHTTSPGVWLQISKKSSTEPSVTYTDALDEALCFGWIDGQKKSHDATSFLQKFTPRRPRSIWSKRNRDHVARLIKEKRMTKAGLNEVAAARNDGRWESAYDSPSTMKVPDDFIHALQKNRKAYDFFLTLNKANIYAIAWRLQTAKKPATRERRMQVLLDMMRAGKKLH
ncbi:MAG TPA: YdeI/OmpD-associated family protein [Gemmatimonadales bacterium]